MVNYVTGKVKHQHLQNTLLWFGQTESKSVNWLECVRKMNRIHLEFTLDFRIRGFFPIMNVAYSEARISLIKSCNKSLKLRRCTDATPRQRNLQSPHVNEDISPKVYLFSLFEGFIAVNQYIFI